ncbi:MAG: hypothetical protein U1E23_06990 [Reyranellaceae bacterium]
MRYTGIANFSRDLSDRPVKIALSAGRTLSLDGREIGIPQNDLERVGVAP